MHFVFSSISDAASSGFAALKKRASMPRFAKEYLNCVYVPP